MPRPRVLLSVLTLLFVSAGAMWLVLPPRLGGGIEPPPATRGFEPPARADVDATLSENIVLANIFSARREPPTARFVPPDDVSSMAAMPANEDSGETGDPPGVDLSMPVLFGTVIGAGGAQALLQLDGARPGARLFSEGEGEGGYRVLSIGPRVVVLAGPRGRVTLRMDHEDGRP
ncbi:MAG: hypothetical protein ABIZ91_01900 [Gemmatimonadaceae bacterium]